MDDRSKTDIRQIDSEAEQDINESELEAEEEGMELEAEEEKPEETLNPAGLNAEKQQEIPSDFMISKEAEKISEPLEQGIKKKHPPYRLFAFLGVIIAAAGILWFNITQKGVGQALYHTTAKPTTEASAEPETEEWVLPKEDVFNHYANISMVGKVDKYLNIRREPSEQADIIGKFLPYSYVNVVGDSGNGWYQIEAEGLIGYVSASHIVTGEEAKKLAMEHGIHRVQVTKENAKGVDAPWDTANELVTLVEGDRYDVVKDNKKGWILIHARHNTECYVNAKDVIDGYFLNEAIMFTSEGEISAARLNFLNNAWMYLGGKYVWGGEELGVGVDCSGYIWKLLQQYDINIHRVSIEQAADGREVTVDQMRPGDLIFYITKGEQISHVAIYTGSGKIIHAASEERGIVTDPWDYLVPQAIRNVID